jgi:type VI secretion system protein ImpK
MIDDDDPFGKTVLKPMPGGRRRPSAPPADDAPRLERWPEPAAVPLSPRSTGLNPLEIAASSLLALLTQLKTLSAHPDPAGLRDRVIGEIQRFEQRARELGYHDATGLTAARYVLCTALDDVVLNTPWGSASVWQQQSLLVTFHREAWGGEKFFQILDRLLQDPGRHIDLLEFMYLLMALGFQGRYRVLKDGRNRLEEVREKLYRTLRSQRGDFERELSPHWRGVGDQRNPLLRYVPLWVVAAVSAVFLLGLYLFFSLRLGVASDPVYAHLSALGKEVAVREVATVRRPPPPPPVATVQTGALRTFLQPEIQRRQVSVEERPDGTTLVIFENLFASGSGTVNRAQLPFLQRIGDALKTVPDPLFRITGHTDNVPIRGVRLGFPSNYELSVARAEAVQGVLMRVTGTPTRFIKAEGRADQQPLPDADNATPEGRARNRRVEIVLLDSGREKQP